MATAIASPRAAPERPRPKHKTCPIRLALADQSALVHASYLVSARTKALTPFPASDHGIASGKLLRRQLVGFCSAVDSDGGFNLSLGHGGPPSCLSDLVNHSACHGRRTPASFCRTFCTGPIIAPQRTEITQLFSGRALRRRRCSTTPDYTMGTDVIHLRCNDCLGCVNLDL